MTEMKYIFPKQLQSVAALAFIAVLIVLLLILTVMVHMRNRKLKSTLEEQMAERRLLDKICADFTAVYYVELNTGSFEILHINDGTNVKKMNLKQGDNFNSSADQYAVQYLYEKERQEFKDSGGGIQVKAHRLFATREEAEKSIEKAPETKKVRGNPYD